MSQDVIQSLQKMNSGFNFPASPLNVKSFKRILSYNDGTKIKSLRMLHFSATGCFSNLGCWGAVIFWYQISQALDSEAKHISLTTKVTRFDFSGLPSQCSVKDSVFSFQIQNDVHPLNRNEGAKEKAEKKSFKKLRKRQNRNLLQYWSWLREKLKIVYANKN